MSIYSDNLVTIVYGGWLSGMTSTPETRGHGFEPCDGIGLIWRRVFRV
jgi:hypothetical protein